MGPQTLTPFPTESPPSALRRFLFGRPDPWRVTGALRALFQSHKPQFPTAVEVQSLLESWGYGDSGRSLVIRETILGDCIEEFLDAQRGYDEQTSRQTEAAAESLSLNEGERRAVMRDVAIEMLQTALDRALEDRKFEPSERDAIAQLAERLSLSAEDVRSTAEARIQPLMDDAVKEVLADGRYTPAEESKLKVLAEGLGARFNVDEGSEEVLSRMRRVWLIENGELPVLHTQINLQKGELLHFTCPATWSEIRTRTTRINYAGPTASIRIMKGVRYRIGSITPMRETVSELVPIQSGTLYITNKRALLDGRSGNKAITWTSVFGIELFSDAVKLEKATGKDPYLAVGPQDIEELAVVVTEILNRRS